MYSVENWGSKDKLAVLVAGHRVELTSVVKGGIKKVNLKKKKGKFETNQDK